MKVTDILIGPAGFTGVLPIPDTTPDPPPPPPPTPEPLRGLFVATQEYSDDLGNVIFAIRCLDDVTGEVLGTWKNNDAGPRSDGGSMYQLYGCKVVDDAVYVLAKGSNGDSMNTYQITLGPEATVDHDSRSPAADSTWALIKFTTQDLSDPEEIIIWHSNGEYWATPASGGFTAAGTTYEACRSILEIFNDIAYTMTVKVASGGGPDVTGCDTGYDRFANSGYSITDGHRVSQDDFGPLGSPTVKRRAYSWCIGPDGFFYTVGTGTDTGAPNEPTAGQVWKGTHGDPFQDLIYDGGGTTGPAGSDVLNREHIIWLCVDPDSGDLFLYWYGGDTGTPQLIDRISSTGTLLDTYILDTTAFTAVWGQSTGICPAMAVADGYLYCSTDLTDFPNTKTIEGGIWKIQISDGSGQGDPAYYFGGPGGGQGVINVHADGSGTGPYNDGYFGEGLLYGMSILAPVIAATPSGILHDSSGNARHLPLDDNAHVESAAGLFTDNGGLRTLDSNNIVQNAEFDGSDLGGDFQFTFLFTPGTDPTTFYLDLREGGLGVSRLTFVFNNDIDADLFTCSLTRTAHDIGSAETFSSDGTDHAVTGPTEISIGYNKTDNQVDFGFDAGLFGGGLGASAPGDDFDTPIGMITFGQMSEGSILDELLIFGDDIAMAGINAINLHQYWVDDDYAGWTAYIMVLGPPVAWYRMDETLSTGVGDSSTFLTHPSSGVIHIIGETDVELSDLSFSGLHTADASVIIEGCTNVYLHDLDFYNVSGAILVVNCDGQLRIEDCRGKDIGVVGETIGSGRHNMIQVASSTTDGSSLSGIRRNKVLGGDTEDMISIFNSGGIGPGQELIIEDNQFESPLPPDGLAWISNSGSGIMLADNTGSYIICRGNTMLNCGQVGIGCAKGEHVEISDNILYGEERTDNNVGIGVGFVVGSPSPGDIHVLNNRVFWVADGGSPNSYYDGGNSGVVDESGNTFDDATIDPDMLHVVL